MWFGSFVIEYSTDLELCGSDVEMLSRTMYSCVTCSLPIHLKLMNFTVYNIQPVKATLTKEGN